MGNIAIKTQGVKGGSPKYKEKIGYVNAFLRNPEDYILVDDFEGAGKTYKQRELTNILIVKNGKTLFDGNKYELFSILENNLNKAI